MHMNIVCTCILYMYGTVDNVLYVFGNYMPTIYMYVRAGELVRPVRPWPDQSLRLGKINNN